MGDMGHGVSGWQGTREPYTCDTLSPIHHERSE